MIKKILLAAFLIVDVAVVAVLGLALMKPDNYRIERSVTIKAPPAKIFPFINDLHKGESWSPFEKLDRAMKKAYSGPPLGKGSMYAWNGNNDAGEGSIEITESVPPSKVAMTLRFKRPMVGDDSVEFTLVPEGDATKVTWHMFGDSPFMSKVMCVFISMDAMMGPTFDEGLASLKAVSEK